MREIALEIIPKDSGCLETDVWFRLHQGPGNPFWPIIQTWSLWRRWFLGVPFSTSSYTATKCPRTLARSSPSTLSLPLPSRVATEQSLCHNIQTSYVSSRSFSRVTDRTGDLSDLWLVSFHGNTCPISLPVWHWKPHWINSSSHTGHSIPEIQLFPIPWSSQPFLHTVPPIYLGSPVCFCFCFPPAWLILIFFPYLRKSYLSLITWSKLFSSMKPK